MTAPFEVPPGSYNVLVNGEGQYSLWPLFLAVPQGWRTAAAAGTRSQCLALIEEQSPGRQPMATMPARVDGVPR